MKFKFKGHIGKSAFFPLPPFVLRLFVYIDCWNFYGNKHNYYYYINHLVTLRGNSQGYFSERPLRDQHGSNPGGVHE